MNLHTFILLSEEVQLAYAYREGNYIARRCDDFHPAVHLYQLPGEFFVEVNYDVEENRVTHLFAFEPGSEDDRLPDYAMFVKLPDWMGGSCEPDG